MLPHRRRLRVALALRRLPAPGPARRAQARRAAVVLAGSGRPSTPPGAGARVALVAGCVQSVVFGDVNAATARVLAAEGYDVHVPRAQGCCGALHAHAGRVGDGVAARPRARRASSPGYDHIVTNAAGCGSHLKDHGIEGAVDVSELLAGGAARDAPPAADRASPSRTPATCATRSGITEQPRAMLDSIPGLRRLEPADQDLCCGSAGIYNIVQPHAAAELGERKARAVLETGADAYASANPGCLVQVSAALRRLGQPASGVSPDRTARRLDSRRRA